MDTLPDLWVHAPLPLPPPPPPPWYCYSSTRPYPSHSALSRPVTPGTLPPGGAGGGGGGGGQVVWSSWRRPLYETQVSCSLTTGGGGGGCSYGRGEGGVRAALFQRNGNVGIVWWVPERVCFIIMTDNFPYYSSVYRYIFLALCQSISHQKTTQ